MKFFILEFRILLELLIVSGVDVILVKYEWYLEKLVCMVLKEDIILVWIDRYFVGFY